ncbi:MAG: PKD domain-containing protein, partial [Candidatus Auribacterota bacterium]
ASGAQITGELSFSGNVTFYNNGSVTPTPFTITGSLNQIYNNSTGYIQFASYNYSNTYFKNNGQIIIQDKTLEIKSGSTFVGQRDFTDADNNLIVRPGGSFISETTQTFNFNEVIVEGQMTHAANGTTAQGEMYKLNLHSLSNFILRPEGVITVSGKGYSEQNGPGVGGTSGVRTSGGGGAGYGGIGSGGSSTTGGAAYGDMANPTSIGSGGGQNTYYGIAGASGGGAVSLDVDGLLAMNGQIVALGYNSPNMSSYNTAGGPGSGGSIKIDAAAMGGSGTISVNGGSRYAGSVAGGGAGGRIAVYCPEYYFAGALTAEGGDGYSQKGGNGTIYMQISSSGSYEGPLNDMVIILPGEMFDPNSSTGKSGSPAPHTAGVPFDVTILAVDALYNVKTNVTDTVRMVSTQNFAQSSPAQQAFNSTGQVTFTVTEYAASASTVINLDDITDNRFDRSSSAYAVLATTPAKMQIIMPGETLSAGAVSGVSGSPSNQIGRIPFSVTVRLVDQYFNKISGRTDAVTLTSSHPNAVIPSFSLSNGSATVTMTEMALGTDRQLTAHVADAQIQDGSSSLFDVVPGPLKELIVLLPGETFTEGVGKSGIPDNIIAGTPFNLTVIAVDDSYNTKGDLSHLIQPESNQQFTVISPESARFSGNTGTLVFTVTQYIAANNKSMIIRDHSNHSFDKATALYNIVNAPASKLQVLLPGETAYPGSGSGKTGQPTVELVGVPFEVKVNLVDAFYNPVQGRSDEVTLLSASGSATIPLFSLTNGSAAVQVVENANGLDISLTASVSDAQIPAASSAQYDIFYKIPAIFSVTPSISKPGLHQVLTIDGENFTDGASLSVTGTGIVLNSFAIVSETQISADINILPTAPVGYRDIILTNPDFAVATGDNMFRVWDPNPPVISNFTYPAEARTGDIITVTFDVDELLQANPVVKIDGHLAVFQDNDSGSYTYTYEVTGTERNGYVYVQAVAKDFVGNVGYVTKYMLLDLNVPVIGYKKVDPAVISPNGNLINDETKISFNIYDEHTLFSALVVIKDSTNTIIKTLWDGALPKPYFRGAWDGKDNDGAYVAEAVYTVETTVTDLANSDVVSASIGTVTVDYDADVRSYILFDEENLYRTVDHGTFTVPVVIRNNDTLSAKSLSEMEVILTDSSVNAYFVEGPSSITLNPGESTTVTVSVDTTIAQSSRVDLTLHIEGAGSDEVDYSNLRLYISPVPRPDIVLFVKDMEFDPQNPDVEGDCEVSVIVKNLGTASASNIQVAFTSFNQPVGQGTVAIPALDIGEEVTVSTTVSFATAGRKLVQIEVDPANTIDELDEYNNDVSKIVQVGQENILSGGIRVLAVGPARAEIGELVEITGRADYAIEINGEMNYDYPVKGGSVTLFIKTTSGDVVATRGGIYTYGGERSGQYDIRFRMPSGFQHGEYALAKIMVTDHTFVGSIQIAIEVYNPVSEPPSVFNPTVVHGSEITGDPDIDGDGVPNYYDWDVDGDFIVNEEDDTPYGDGGGYYGGSGGGFTGRSNPVITSDGSFYYPRSAGVEFEIPDGAKIYPGTGESAIGEYQGVTFEPENYPYDAYVHSCDIAFSNDNPDQFEEIYIGAIIWAEGGGYKEIPVSFFEVYPAGQSITQIGVTQVIPRLEAGRNASVVTSWQNQGDGIYIIEAHLDNEGYADPDSYTDGNNLNNEASRAIIVGEFNELLDVLVNSPVQNVTYVCLRDTILINFEVWRGLDSLAPEELDILTIMFDDSLAMTRDLIIVKDGVLVNGEYNPLTGVYTMSVPAPLPAGESVNGLYPGSIMVAAQTHSDDDILNGAGTVNVNLTLSANPPETMSLDCTACDATLAWSAVADGVSKYNIYRNNELLATVDHPVNVYTDETVEKDQTYEYFVMSVSSATNEEGIITSPADEVTIEKMTPVIEAGPDQGANVNALVLFEGIITDDGCDDPYICEWDFGDGTSTEGTLTPSHTYTETGIYTVHLTVTDEYGTEYTDTLLMDITRTVIGIDAGTDQTVTEGDSVSFQAAITDGSGSETYTYFWDFGDGDNDTGSLSAGHVYADNGQYTVTVTVTDTASSAVGEDFLTVTVQNAPPSLVVDPDFEVFEGDIVELVSTTYTDPGTADTHIASIDWDDGSTAQFPAGGGQISLNHAYLNYGVYTVSLGITDDDGGNDSETLQVTVNRKPIDIAIFAENDLSATISFSGVAGKSYEIWYSDDPFSEFGDTFVWSVAGTVAATDSGDFACTYTDSGNPGTDGIFGTADDVRSAPYQADTRYYRVVLAGSVGAGDPWASEDIAFYHAKVLYEGRNYIGKIGAGQSQALNEIIDCRFLPGAITMQSAASVMYWENGAQKSAFTLDYDNSKSWSDGAYDVSGGAVDVNNGLMLTIPPGKGIQLAPMSGIVEMADSVAINVQPGGYNLLTWPYADAVELDNSGLIENGFEAGMTARTSDQIYFWNPEFQKYDLPVFYSSVFNGWRNYDQTPCTRKIYPGESILIKPKPTSAFSEWNIQRKYIKSTRTLE